MNEEMTTKEFLELCGFDVYTNKNNKNYCNISNWLSKGDNGEIFNDSPLEYVPINKSPREIIIFLLAEAYRDGKRDGIIEYTDQIKLILDPFSKEADTAVYSPNPFKEQIKNNE